MEQVSRKRFIIGVFLGLLLILNACSRAIAPQDEPQATLIDLAPQQTLTALSFSENTPTETITPTEEFTLMCTPPACAEGETYYCPGDCPGGCGTVCVTAVPPIETPPSATRTNEMIDPTQESSTGTSLIVTQTVTPVSVPAAGSGSSLVVEYLGNPPAIDGDIGDWPGTIYAIDKIVFGSEFYANQVDLFGEFKIGWDSQYLYLGVLVRDSRFIQTATDALLFQGDSIEVLLDSDWNGDLNSDKLSADDYQLGFSPGNLLDISIPEGYLWAPTDREGALELSQVNGRLTDDGYMVEIAIAWAEIGVTPVGGMPFGFLLSVSDNDSIGKNEQQTVISISETRNLTNPSTWMPAELANP